MDKRIQRALDVPYCVFPCNIILWRENGTSIRSFKGRLVELDGLERKWYEPVKTRESDDELSISL